MIAIASSVQGYSHIKSNIPNQDTFCYLKNEDNNIFVAVISDGAGSAANAKLGSSLCCYNLTQSLLDISVAVVEQKLEASWYREKILSVITKHLDIISDCPDTVKSYNHTLSAIIFSPFGGKIIQIGDSPVVIIKGKAEQKKSIAGFLDNTEVFDEEKQTEYVNFTNFLTNPSWRSNIRIENLPKDSIGFFAMSDGAGSIFIQKKKLFTPAINELFNRFNKNKYIDKTLTDFLSMEAINGITGDDKTFLAYFPTEILDNSPQFTVDYTNHNITDDIYPLLPSGNKTQSLTSNKAEDRAVSRKIIADSKIKLDKEAFEKIKSTEIFEEEGKKKPQFEYNSMKNDDVQSQLIAVLVISVLLNIVAYCLILIDLDSIMKF